MMRKASLLIVLFLAVSASGWACCSSGLSDNGLVIIGTDFGSGPNAVSATHLDIHNGTAVALDTLYLLIGLPNTVPASAVTVTNGTVSGSCSQFRSGFDTTLDNPFDNCTTLHSVASGKPTSDTLTNWITADAAWGVTATYFNLYLYALSPPSSAHPLSIGATLGVDTSRLPVGTIEAAYGWASGNSGTCYYTGYDNAGIVTPEPASFIMVGGAALALLGRRLWKRKS